MRRFRWTTLFLAALVVAACSVVAFARGVALMVDDSAEYVHTVLVPALAVIAVLIVLSFRFARRVWNCRPFGVEPW